MKSFLQVYDDTRQRLCRQLQDNEIEFLHWMYERYKEEQQKSKHLVM